MILRVPLPSFFVGAGGSHVTYLPLCIILFSNHYVSYMDMFVVTANKP